MRVSQDSDHDEQQAHGRECEEKEDRSTGVDRELDRSSD